MEIVHWRRPRLSEEVQVIYVRISGDEIRCVCAEIQYLTATNALFAVEIKNLGK